MIDWSKAVEAVPVHGGRIVHVSANRSFHRLDDTGHAVDFSSNPWCASARGGGTYYVNKDGLISVGISPEGYGALYYVRNVGTNDEPHQKVLEARAIRGDALFVAAIKRGFPDPVV